VDGMVNEAMPKITIEATSKENNYSKHTLLITFKAGTGEY